jgi:hypothetical protein
MDFLKLYVFTALKANQAENTHFTDGLLAVTGVP